MDSNPKLNSAPHGCLEKLMLKVPPGDALSPMDLGPDIENLTDLLIGNIGCVYLDSHAYCSLRREHRSPTTMTPNGILCFEGVVDDGPFLRARDVAVYGAKPHGHASPIGFRQAAYARVSDDQVGTSSRPWVDLAEGRLFLFAVKSEALLRIWWIQN